MIKTKKLCCGDPRTIEEQICDLQYQIDQLKLLAISASQGKGQWNETTQYEAGDVVKGSNGSYFATVPNSGHNPDLPANVQSYWQPLAEDGTDGVDGNGISSIIDSETYDTGDYTVTPITFNMTKQPPKQMGVFAKNGAPGSDGTSVDNIVSISHHVEGDETVTTCQVNYDMDKTPTTFDVHAKNGAAVPYITITNPSTATSGILTDEQYDTLLSDPFNAYIVFAGEKYIPMDVNATQGYSVYTHHGEDVTSIPYVKFIYLLYSTKSWTKTIGKKQYLHTIKSIQSTNLTNGASFSATFISNRPTVYNSFIEVMNDVPNVLAISGTIFTTSDGEHPCAYAEKLLTGIYIHGYYYKPSTGTIIDVLVQYPESISTFTDIIKSVS